MAANHEMQKEAQPLNHQEEVAMLKDVYLHGMRSSYYVREKKANRIQNNHVGLKKAIKNRSTLDAIACIAEEGNETLIQPPQKNILHKAAAAGYTAFCEFLIDAKIISVDTLNEFAETALHAAVRECKLEACRLLLSHGANVEAESASGLTPIGYALTKTCLYGRHKSRQEVRDIVYLLLKNNAHLNLFTPVKHLSSSPESRERRCLFDRVFIKEVKHDFRHLYPLLLELGGQPHMQDTNGQTILHRIARTHDKLKFIIEVMGCLAVAHLCAQERQIIMTVLLIHKRKDSLLSRIPKDVIKHHILAHLCPFVKGDVAECVEQEVKFLEQLFAIKDNQGLTANDLLYKRRTWPSNDPLWHPEKVKENKVRLTAYAQNFLNAQREQMIVKKCKERERRIHKGIAKPNRYAQFLYW